MFGIYGTQIMTGKYSLGSSLFGIPFFLGSVFLVSWCLMTVAGQVTVARHSDQLTIFTGVGSIGWTRTCALSDFSSVREGYANFPSWNNRQGPSIRLEGKRAVAFGSMLSTDRRYFLLKVLQGALPDAGRSAVFPSR